MHQGNGIVLGELGGETSHTLNISELPAHSHTVVGSSDAASLPTAAGNSWATRASLYNSTINTSMNPACIPTAIGGNQPHENMSPYLVLNFIIALQGIFPSQN